MKSIQFLTLLIFSTIFMSCDMDKTQMLRNEITLLQNKNDSLNTVLDTLKTKFIFDNAHVKHIVNENKPIIEGKNYTGEFYFVAYNDEDRLLFRHNSSKVSDSISKIKSGGYIYHFKAEKGKNVFNFKPLIRNDLAKEFANGIFFDVNLIASREAK